jgi:hypothetical protein
MKRPAALAALTIYGLIGYELGALAEDQFKKLSGTQIRAKFTGMEFTDQVHWGEVYESSGKLRSEEMGTKRTGTWRIQKDQLCTDYGKEVASSCYEVWMSGKMSSYGPRVRPVCHWRGFWRGQAGRGAGIIVR